MVPRVADVVPDVVEVGRGFDGRMYTCGPYRLRLRAHRQFPHFHLRGPSAALAAASGFALDHVMNITDVDDKIIRNAVAQHKSLEEYTEVYTQASSRTATTLRLERPERWTPATKHIDDMVHAIERLADRRPHLYERRLGLLPHRDVPRIRQAFAQRFQRQHRGRPRRRGRIRKGRRPRFRPVESPQGRRSRLGDADRPRPPRLAHRVLRDGDQVPGRDARYPRRRHRPHLPASRKRDRAIGSAHRQAVRALLAARRVSDGGRPEDVEVARQFLYPARPAGEGLLSRKPSATCWPRCLIASSSTSPSTG